MFNFEGNNLLLLVVIIHQILELFRLQLSWSMEIIRARIKLYTSPPNENENIAITYKCMMVWQFLDGKSEWENPAMPDIGI